MIELQQPRALDLIGNPVMVGGQSVTFEANIEWRAVKAGATASGFFQGGGSISVRQFQAALDLSALVSVDLSKGAEIQLSLFSRSPADGAVTDLATVPVLLGDRLVADFEGWQPRTVAAGDTLSSIAAEVYSNEAAWPTLFEANRDRLNDPDLIFAGQEIRVPLGSSALLLA